MSPLIASKIKLVISSIFCCHVLLSVRSPFNLSWLFKWQTSKPHNSKAQARFTDKKNSMSHLKISQIFAFIACEVFELPEPKSKTKLKQILDCQTLVFFARNNSKVQENAGKQVAISFFFEWSNLKAKLTKTNAISDHLRC